VTFRPGDQWFAYARTEYTALGAPGYGQLFVFFLDAF
jgi:hypothetical protein